MEWDLGNSMIEVSSIKLLNILLFKNWWEKIQRISTKDCLISNNWKRIRKLINLSIVSYKLCNADEIYNVIMKNGYCYDTQNVRSINCESWGLFLLCVCVWVCLVKISLFLVSLRIDFKEDEKCFLYRH